MIEEGNVVILKVRCNKPDEGTNRLDIDIDIDIDGMKTWVLGCERQRLRRQAENFPGKILGIRP